MLTKKKEFPTILVSIYYYYLFMICSDFVVLKLFYAQSQLVFKSLLIINKHKHTKLLFKVLFGVSNSKNRRKHTFKKQTHIYAHSI